MGDIFGGSQQESESGNKAYPFIMQNYGASGARDFNNGSNMLGNILGAGGNPAAGQAALKNYWNSAGGNFQMGQGMDALTSKFASQGLLKSGAAMKGMETFRQGLASTYLNNYLGQLGDLAKLGLGAGGLVADAGQWSKGSGSSSPGMGGFLGSLIGAAAMASDIGLKENVVRVGEFADGLGKYEFDYNRDLDPELPPGRFCGVIAQEVQKLRPWALGPVRPDGCLTVVYGAL